MELGEVVLYAAGIAGGLAGFLAIDGWGRRWYRETLGRRRDSYERLRRLGTGAQLSFFESVLGEPPAIRRTTTWTMRDWQNEDEEPLLVQRDLQECFFVDRDFYVQAYSDEDETVVAFSVTSRQQGFRPTFTFPLPRSWWQRRRWKARFGRTFPHLFSVTLGRTHFDEVLRPGEWGDPVVKCQVGARMWSYSEHYYFGNPGYYQTYVFTASSVADFAPTGDIVSVDGAIGPRYPKQTNLEALDAMVDATLEGGDEFGVDGLEEAAPLAKIPAVVAFRSATVITTYSVLNSPFDENYDGSYGPHGDEVRTLP